MEKTSSRLVEAIKDTIELFICFQNPSNENIDQIHRQIKSRILKIEACYGQYIEPVYNLHCKRAQRLRSIMKRSNLNAQQTIFTSYSTMEAAEFILSLLFEEANNLDVFLNQLAAYGYDYTSITTYMKDRASKEAMLRENLEKYETLIYEMSNLDLEGFIAVIESLVNNNTFENETQLFYYFGMLSEFFSHLDEDKGYVWIDEYYECFNAKLEFLDEENEICMEAFSLIKHIFLQAKENKAKMAKIYSFYNLLAEHFPEDKDLYQELIELLPKRIIYAPRHLLSFDGYTLANGEMRFPPKYFLTLKFEEMNIINVVLAILHELVHKIRLFYQAEFGYLPKIPKHITGYNIESLEALLRTLRFGFSRYIGDIKWKAAKKLVVATNWKDNVLEKIAKALRSAPELKITKRRRCKGSYPHWHLTKQNFDKE
jgi:hypothetical protein